MVVGGAAGYNLFKLHAWWKVLGIVTYEQVLGMVVKRERTNRELTQEQLAARCGCHPTFISQIENGHRNPTVKQFMKIAFGLGLEPDVLLHRVLGEMKERNVVLAI
jgi:transcriptional regulator with XRE-family HTH domain